VSTSESQVYARALYDGLVGDAQKALKAAAKQLGGVQGDPATLRKLEAWCRQGPPAARVDAVEVEATTVDPALRGFVSRTGRS